MNRYDIALGKKPPPKPKSWDDMTPEEQSTEFNKIMDKGFDFKDVLIDWGELRPRGQNPFYGPSLAAQYFRTAAQQQEMIRRTADRIANGSISNSP